MEAVWSYCSWAAVIAEASLPQGSLKGTLVPSPVTSHNSRGSHSCSEYRLDLLTPGNLLFSSCVPITKFWLCLGNRDRLHSPVPTGETEAEKSW